MPLAIAFGKGPSAGCLRQSHLACRPSSLASYGLFSLHYNASTGAAGRAQRARVHGPCFPERACSLNVCMLAVCVCMCVVLRSGVLFVFALRRIVCLCAPAYCLSLHSGVLFVFALRRIADPCAPAYCAPAYCASAYCACISYLLFVLYQQVHVFPGFKKPKSCPYVVVL